MSDLVALERSHPEPAVGIDPADRALLVQLYRELVGTVEGPIVPFPVELMEDPELVEDREQPAPLLDLRAFRDRRAAAVEAAVVVEAAAVDADVVEAAAVDAEG